MDALASLSPEMREILRIVAVSGEYRAAAVGDRVRGAKMHGRGWVRRHETDTSRFFPTDLGLAIAAELGLVGVIDVTAAPLVGQGALSQVGTEPAADLVAVVSLARELFDAGDIDMALKISTVAYDEAKAAAGSAEKVKASRALIDKARRMQGEALKIESLCYVAMADAVDEAQAKGHISIKGGRPETVQSSDRFTLEDIGIDKRRLHEARSLRNKVRDEPGYVDRVVEARLSEGLEPTRASIRSAIGTRAAPKSEQGDKLYETPDVATRSLLALESFSGVLKEPFVGRAAILRVVEDAGYDAVISDLRDRGTATRHGELQQVGDFLQSDPGETVGMDIISNPPYGADANACLAHALRVHRPRKMAMLLNLNFMCGFDDPDRAFVMDENPPSRVYVFTRRLPMMHRDGWTGPEASSQMNTAWFVWEMNPDGTYGRARGQWETIRVDWKALADRPALAPGAGGHVAPMIFADQGDDDEDYTRTTPRLSMEERVEGARGLAKQWVFAKVSFSRRDLRREIGVRDSVAEALISEMIEQRLVGAADEEGVHLVLASESEAA